MMNNNNLCNNSSNKFHQTNLEVIMDRKTIFKNKKYQKINIINYLNKNMQNNFRNKY